MSERERENEGERKTIKSFQQETASNNPDNV